MARSDLVDKLQINKKVFLVISALILLSGIAMMTFGVLRGELQMIYHKATIICLECIGIG